MTIFIEYNLSLKGVTKILNNLIKINFIEDISQIKYLLNRIM